MGSHRSKTAKIRGFNLSVNMRLGLNELTYSLLIAYMFLFMNFALYEYPLAHCQLRQSKLFLPYRQHIWFSSAFIEILCREEVYMQC